MYITLNSQRYYLVPGSEFTWSNVQELSTAFRTTGVQQRADNLKVNRAVRGWDQGIGFSRLRRDRGYAINGMRDATANTMHSSQITLNTLHESQTHADPAEHPKVFLRFKGDFWGIFEEDYASGEDTGVFARLYGSSSDDWTGGGTISTWSSANAKGIRVWDAVVHKDDIYVSVGGDLVGPQEIRTRVLSSANGASWSDPGNTGADSGNYLSTTITRRNNFDDDYGRLLDFGNTLMQALRGSSEVRVYYSVDEGANWTRGATIPSGDGPKAFVNWRDPFSNPIGAESPTLITAEGVYRVDAGGTTFNLIYELDGNPNNGRRAAVGQDGGLIVGLGNGGRIVLYVTAAGGITVRGMGDPGDGLVAARQGHVNYVLAPALPWYFLAYGGHASDQQASIFAVEYQWRENALTGKPYQVWHSMYLEADDDVDLYLLGFSSEDDGTPRLHFALEGAAAAEMYHLENPVTDPVSGVTMKYQPGSSNTQYVEWAEDDLSDPHSSAAVYRVLAEADDLSASTSGEYIAAHYGLDGAAWNNVSLGNFLSGDKDLDPGTSSRGVSAKTFRLRMELNRDGGDTTQTPKLKEVEVQSRNKMVLLERYGNLAIDLGLTAQQERITPFEVFTRLRADIISVTSLGFTLGSRWSEQQVEVVGFEAALDSLDKGVSVESQEVSGVVNLTVEEVLNV
jgi:hypothetical protein